LGLLYRITLLSTSSTGGDSFYELLQSNILFMLALLIIFGVVGGSIVSKFKFPKVTGYIVVGLIIGPSVLGIFNHEMVENFTIIRQVAIGFIGYTIGLELRFSKLKKTGKQVTVITIVQAVSTALLVTIAILFFVQDRELKWTYALILGAIATATAPGPIISVVKNNRTKGPVTNILLPLVALDDAIGIMFFAVMLSVGVTLLNLGGEVLSIAEILWEPVREIGVSIIAGAVIGLTLSFILNHLKKRDASEDLYLLVIIASLFLGIGFGLAVHASAILLPMTIGVVITNTVSDEFEHKLTRISDLYSAPILLAFFMIAGMELNLAVLRVIGVIGVVYVIVRVVGKVSGAYVGAKLVNAPPTVVKYLGWTLIPQAGVAIDMALTADLRFQALAAEHGAWIGDIGSTIMTIVLAATLVYEVFGLVIVKRALASAGEIGQG